MRWGVAILATLVCLGLPSVELTASAAAPVPSDPQCTGQGYVEAADDDVRADELMSGRLRLSNFDTWDLPDNLSWTEDPYSDSNWVFQLNSLSWADPLRRVGLATHNQAMLDRYEAIIHDWVEDNPVDDPRSKYSWYDMADGFRAIALVCLAATLPDEPRWLTDAIETHAEMLSDPARYASTGNHGLYQNLGLLALGCSFDEAAWRNLAVQRVTTLLDLAVDEQGVTNEGSVEYQDSNHLWYLQLRAQLDRCGLARIPGLARVDLMPDFLAHATQPDGYRVPWGDTAAAGIVAQGPLPGIHSGPHPDRTFAIFKRGYAFSRSGWFDTQPGDRQSLASIRFGEPRALAIHGHRDSGAVSFFAQGRQLLWQPGLWGGAGGAPRRYVISNSAHNVIDIAGATYDDSAATTLVTATGSYARDLVTVRSNSLSGATWQRTMVHAKVPGLLLVDDQVTQTTSRSVRQHWQLGADRAVTTTGCERADTSGPGSNVTLLWADACPQLSVASGQTSPMLGWISPRVNEFVPASTVVARRAGLQARLTTILVPRPDGMAANQVRLLESRTRGARRTVSIQVGAKVYEIAFTSTGASVLSVRSPSRTKTRLDRSTRRARLQVRVQASTKATATGRVVVRTAGRKVVGRLANGVVSVRLPRLAPGRYVLRTAYAGSIRVAPSKAANRRYVVRSRH